MIAASTIAIADPTAFFETPFDERGFSVVTETAVVIVCAAPGALGCEDGLPDAFFLFSARQLSQRFGSCNPFCSYHSIC